jgi:putative component of toxin-antitoxin plasmid stabilization module
MIKIRKTPEFDGWLSSLNVKEQAQIEARLYRIEAFSHFGDCKLLQGTDSFYTRASLEKWVACIFL